ncbi:MAG: hypothetical protein DRP42_00540 [Tenericutes bacterium]|nr:MAG: hypothetical protein DRP42_00540 [Mycoplasmatota bacterium]
MIRQFWTVGLTQLEKRLLDDQKCTLSGDPQEVADQLKWVAVGLRANLGGDKGAVEVLFAPNRPIAIDVSAWCSRERRPLIRTPFC